ncbi:MAG: GDSL-type esterase/lipase family protein [Balneolales bacterium]
MKREEKEELLDYLVQFLNIEKQFPLLPGVNDQSAVAQFIGIDEDELSSIRANFDENTKQAAFELLKDETVKKQIKNLPFKKDDKIAVIGDALTDDLQSWFPIFRHVMEIGVMGAKFSWYDASMASETTANILMRLDRDVLANKPDWVIIALGSDDAKRPHLATTRTLVSLAEFWENTNTIESAIQLVVKNPIIWITPPPPVTELMQQHPLFNGVVHEEDLKQYREVIAGKQGYIVDPTGNRLGNPPEAWNLLGDGYHPSLVGHLNTVKALIGAMNKDKQDTSEEIS